MASILGVSLPHEVWEIILGYLSTTDILNFCSSSAEYKIFLHRKNVVRNFDASFNYLFFDTNLCHFIKTNVDYQYIHTLNINKLFWASLEELRRLIKLLPNLEELLALNTQLSVRPKDIALYGKLKTLAVSINGAYLLDLADSGVYTNNLYLLTKFCAHIQKKYPNFFYGLHKIFSAMVAVQEVWIYDSDSDCPHPVKYDAIVGQLKFLKKLVIKSRVNIPFLDYKPFGLAKYFETRRFKSIAMRYEHFQDQEIVPFKEISIFEPLETRLERAWEVFRTYRSEMPYDPNTHRKIYLTRQIKDIKFEELNFYHNKCFCTRDYVSATWDFLRSENSRDLKKLSIKSCVLQSEYLLKDKRTMSFRKEYPIKDIIEHCQKVSTLELMQCCRSHFDWAEDDNESNCNVTIVDAYSFIYKWNSLEQLTLDLPGHVRGDFLIDIATHCKKLKYLRLISSHTNEGLNRNIFKALPHANQLQDFCLDTKTLNLPVLFESLAKIQSRQLRRIFISCDSVNASDLDSLEEFLNLNPQLVLLFVAITKSTRSYLKSIQEKFSVYMKANRSKQFYARKQYWPIVKQYYVFDANDDLFTFDSSVANVDFYSFR